MKEMICIVCPRGCHLKFQEGKIEGNFCKRGEVYGLQEVFHPMRMVTSTVSLVSKSGRTRLPVVTSKEVPKEKMMEVMDVIHRMVVYAPISLHQVLFKNVLNLGVDILAAKEEKD